ncbi:hypothetical protein ACFQT0_22360 [Hymenobacter humi]|uniref:DUF4282 domain-containing protein n=1 Tax=Hymenobacter humi TaxID=1411620 RepID=A0ABW2UAF2_9BACT
MAALVGLPAFFAGIAVLFVAVAAVGIAAAAVGLAAFFAGFVLLVRAGAVLFSLLDMSERGIEGERIKHRIITR